uniref:Uncharacterized protein n=1 Tax=Neisseria meningitidis alpha153 TaxID=663926 RepID=C6SCQ5_NEIME|nr:hypothetical protein predicted by Glimmer/Critica [Neisseria meningitidis alpha153]
MRLVVIWNSSVPKPAPKKRKSRIQTGQQGNQHHCAECHK